MGDRRPGENPVTTSDDFTTYNADQARVKFARAQYDAITTDQWVALVNQLDAVLEQQELELVDLRV